LKKISIVLPVFQEEKFIYENIKTIISFTDQLNYIFELIIIDDGSRDATWNELQRLASNYSNTKLIKFSRNFGKEAAICAGLDFSTGDACIIMDSDLQHPPALIKSMVTFWEEGAEVVEAIKSSRGEEKTSTKIFSILFYKLLNAMTGTDLKGASDFKLLDKKVVDSWKTMKERVTFFRGMSEWLGFNKKKIPFIVEPRMGGETKWSFKSLFVLAKNAITAFSTVPLHFVTTVGIFSLLGFLVLFIQTLYQKVMGNAVSGFTTVILLLLIIGSLLMISVGIIGEYIARIYEEVKMRPRYLIGEIVNASTEMQNKEKQLITHE
jgi:glycosyltransferase involved in cell wall biosynthesis